MRLANAHALRAYDAVQLAAVLELNSRYQASGLGGITLVSADRDLNTAATAEGMAVEDPKFASLRNFAADARAVRGIAVCPGTSVNADNCHIHFTQNLIAIHYVPFAFPAFIDTARKGFNQRKSR